jgi:hypothetical protein
MLPTKFQFIWESGFRGEDRSFFKSTNQKQEWPVVAMFVNGSELNEQSFQGCFLPSFDSFGLVVSEEKILLEINKSEKKNGQWWPCLLTDRDKMSNLYRGPSIDASYQVPVHLAKQFQSSFRGEDFFKSANQKQELPVVAMFVNGSGQNETAHIGML